MKSKYFLTRFSPIAEEDVVLETIEGASETVVDDVAERVNSVIIRIEKEVIKEKLGVDVNVNNDVEIVVTNIDANDIVDEEIEDLEKEVDEEVESIVDESEEDLEEVIDSVMARVKDHITIDIKKVVPDVGIEKIEEILAEIRSRADAELLGDVDKQVEDLVEEEIENVKDVAEKEENMGKDAEDITADVVGKKMRRILSLLFYVLKCLFCTKYSIRK